MSQQNPTKPASRALVVRLESVKITVTGLKGTARPGSCYSTWLQRWQYVISHHLDSMYNGPLLARRWLWRMFLSLHILNDVQAKAQ